jgi:transcriptional regulator with XRE-family HTH domain
MEYLGMKLKGLRQEHGMTQSRLAKYLELVPATISSYETGSNYPSADVIIKLCRFFNVSADSLLGLSDTRELKSAGLTDEQYQIIASLIAQFGYLNSMLAADGK